MKHEDHIDRFLAELEPIEGLDYEVEGIVDRIGGLNRRIKRGMMATLAEYGLSHGDWEVLTALRNFGNKTPGALASHLELSSGAMTSRLDGLEKDGLIKRTADPGDRRSVVIELTDKGRTAWDEAATAQARKEIFFASALSPAEQKRLNALLRKLMIAFEAIEPDSKNKH